MGLYMIQVLLALLKIISGVPSLERIFDVLVRIYLVQRYNIGQLAFRKAERLARSGRTIELQKEIGKFLVLALLLASCASPGGAPLTSLCQMDYEVEMCWTDKIHAEGVTFEEMRAQQKKCIKEEGENVPCWYGIDTVDLQRIHSRLSQGR